MKKGIFTRLFATMLVFAMCFAMSAPAFAAEVESESCGTANIEDVNSVAPLSDNTVIRADPFTFSGSCKYRMTCVRANVSGTVKVKLSGNPNVYYTVKVITPSGKGDSKTILANGSVNKVYYYLSEPEGQYTFEVFCNDPKDLTSINAVFYIYD